MCIRGPFAWYAHEHLYKKGPQLGYQLRSFLFHPVTGAFVKLRAQQHQAGYGQGDAGGHGAGDFLLTHK